MAKAKSLIYGYSSPKPFDISESERCIDYDISVVENWLSALRAYTNDDSLTGKKVLELGPGSDLGVGIYLLAKGCAQYSSYDVNDLMQSTPDSFYEKLFERLKELNLSTEIDFLRTQMKAVKTQQPSQLNTVVGEDFDLVSAFGKSTIDLVVSQAAFEHFDNIDETVSQLSAVCKPGAVSIIEVDLKTHSRWIRTQDPNNIYRYPKFIYDMFWFRGIPNRVRPLQYKAAFERFDWTDVSISPLSTIDERHHSCTGLNQLFAGRDSQMQYLSIMLCARKKAAHR
ncbi:MAG: class I SAM-dependent methyltransferase [Phormidesmis sp.]